MFHISGEISNTLFDPHLARSYNYLVLSALSLPTFYPLESGDRGKR